MKFTEFRNNARKSEGDFTRERKVGFVPLVLLIFNMVRKSSQLEIDEFRERFMPESAQATTYTKQSFSKARQKIRPEAFVTLNDVYIRTFYADHDYKTQGGSHVCHGWVRTGGSKHRANAASVWLCYQ